LISGLEEGDSILLFSRKWPIMMIHRCQALRWDYIAPASGRLQRRVRRSGMIAVSVANC
jgi:hypothetical protein